MRNVIGVKSLNGMMINGDSKSIDGMMIWRKIVDERKNNGLRKEFEDQKNVNEEKEF